ncbi:MAG: NnrS family protein [Zetaproteobacteria bacterium CG_4_9_14_3_um_filter_49_83]|nr:MAG: NnrS family protein [Zetaproteobacteria bacterium CG1_02_49_23]PIQ30915.1 MAG: NnrS family protein [Zetaproteobacteria bacterium CG17_big_fil_post_rev_8_21_14_2_50_50_13]PIV30842.1 MAG: NnrS family protein [Zetaproteobacteria bacterium CG02_land_8_20_14_3_00_50_9]PIY56234.1 MAG: NnrS family protein [Zetaproteobacteria bacterium CG_4_10_14_0_8_um_filter_49_80]PJA34717.1 MAG: NnrS family protein [Zetaproteobacteria bacterium CG_4_9_14_3_um_filter_49_83]
MIKSNSAEPQQDVSGVALFRLGFRPFFLAATCFAIVSMAFWMAESVFALRLFGGKSPSLWHAHEMIYGYGLAIVAGFLLTAVRNWTHIRTPHGKSLQGLLFVWVLARMAALIPGQQALLAGAMLDSLFIVLVSIALTVPIVQAKLWSNMGVVSMLYFFLPGQLLYSLDAFGLFQDGQRIGNAIGLYMILSLVLVFSRRVMPMFIDRGVGYAVTLRNHAWVDMACFGLFMVFAIADIFFVVPEVTGGLAAVLVVLHTLRLSGWYTHGIWKKPLLWVLYVAYVWIIVGFTLKSLVLVFAVPASLAIHAFAVGGVGMMTLGMMSRISLGHTGRNVAHPPTGVSLMFLLLCLGACVRVILPLLASDYYQILVAVAQLLWVASFMQFLYLYALILIRPRVDGQWG